jgi:predicted extracellular nuclease
VGVTSDEAMSRAEEEDEVEEATVEDVVEDEEEEAVATVGEEVEEVVVTAGEEVEEVVVTAGEEVEEAVAQEAIRPEVLLEKDAELLITLVHLQDPHMAKADPRLVAQGAEEEEPLAIDMKEVQTTAGK